MDDTYVTIILALVSFLEVIFMFLVAYIFKMIGTIFNKLDSYKKECNDNLEKYENRTTELLRNNYAKSGDLTTLEASLIGKIDVLTTAINGLTDTIKSKL